MEATHDVIVAGGGVIGAAVAWRLGEQGERVLLLEREQMGQGASAAAAGMLGAQHETEEPGDFFQLCVQSRAMFPSLAAELMEQTGVDIELSTQGTLRIARGEEDVERLRAAGEWQRATGNRAVWLGPDEVAAREPALAPTRGALWLPDDVHVRAPRMAQALARAARRHARVAEGEAVLAYRVTGGAVEVTTTRGHHRASRLVLAAGAWTGTIAGDAAPPEAVGPVKGQLLCLRPDGAPALRSTVAGGAVYLVPKTDGTVIVGATQEPEAGFAPQVTARAMGQLLSAALDVAPALAGATVERAWSGFRPTTPSKLPIIGPDAEHPEVLWATGHHRNGILLAPVTAAMIVAAIRDEEVPSHWAAFAPAGRREGTLGRA